MGLGISLSIIITVIAVIFSGLFSGSEIAFVQSSKVRREIDAANGGLVNRLLQTFSHHEDMFISSLLVGNNVVLVIYGIAFSDLINPILNNWFDNSEALVLITNTLLSTGLILITGEFLPKSVFRVNPNVMMRIFALPLYLAYLIFYPVSLLVSYISKGLMRLLGIRTPEAPSKLLTMDELDDYIQHSIEENTGKQAVENEVKIFRKAIDFKDTQIAECMTPRNEIVSVPIEGTTREDLLNKFIDTGLSKVVVYKEDIDDIVGYIHVSELFNPEADWKKKLKPVIFTPETMLANKMMRRLMSEKKSMAIVIDEFGGTAGLVTLEDLVEEIFGEIEDEHDRKRVVARKIGVDAFIFSGRAEINMINEEFGLNIKEADDYHTIAGYILDSLEALPREGETFDLGNLRFSIKKMSTTRIELVKVEKLPEEKRE
ncbi:MAG: hemolysin family protein [Muribaculaceae bacterium]|nr:hemolysin family protein [Muribaculaceae bacterium]